MLVRRKWSTAPPKSVFSDASFGNLTSLDVSPQLQNFSVSIYCWRQELAVNSPLRCQKPTEGTWATGSPEPPSAGSSA